MVQIHQVAGSDGAPDLLISVEREKLKTVAKPAIGTFLNKLQVCDKRCYSHCRFALAKAGNTSAVFRAVRL